MANKIVFDIGFNVNKNNLTQLTNALKNIQSIAKNSSIGNGITDGFKEAAVEASKLESILKSAWNSDLQSLNLSKVNEGIRGTYGSVDQLRTRLSKAGAEGQAAFSAFSKTVLQTQTPLRTANQLLNNMAATLKNTIKWNLSSAVVNEFTKSIQSAYGYVKALDTSLNDIRIVTGQSAQQMQRFAKTAQTAAKGMGASTLDYTKAALIYYQQGLKDADVQARAQTTLKAANVTAQSGQEVSEQLTAVWNGYKVSAEETQLYVDKLAAVAATTAADLQELSTGMSKVASAANAMGVDVDQLNAQISTIVSVTRQAPESVGTALKTIYARIGQLKSDGTDQFGVTLGQVSGKLAKMGIQILDVQGNIRDMGTVVQEIGGKWDEWTRSQQLAVAQAAAGTRQYNNLIALFDNWDQYNQALKTSKQAIGTLQEQQDIYMQSTAAKLQVLSTQQQRTFDTLFDTNTFNTLTEALTFVIQQFNDFISGLGSGGAALTYFGSLATQIFSDQIGKSIATTIQNVKSLKQQISAADLKDQIIASHQGQPITDKALQAELEVAQKISAVKGIISQQEYASLTAQQQKIGSLTQQIEEYERQESLLSGVVDLQNSNKNQLRQKLTELQSQQKIYHEIVDELRTLTSLPNNASNPIDVSQINKKFSTEVQEGLVSALQSANVQFGNATTNAQKLAYAINSGALSADTIKTAIAQVGSKANLTTEQIEALANVLKGAHEAAVNTKGALERGVTSATNFALSAKKISDNLRTASMIINSVTAITGGLKTSLDDSATAAQKLNGTFTAITGSAQTVAQIIGTSIGGPALGMIAGQVTSAVLGLVKSAAELGGVWDDLQDKFKSTAQRYDQILQKQSELAKASAQFKNRKQSIEDLRSQYELLSQKAGQYGQNVASMTDQEQARYHQIINKIAQYSDELVAGFDSQGNAILTVGTNIDTIIQKLEKEYAAQQKINSLDTTKTQKRLFKDVDKEFPEFQNLKYYASDNETYLRETVIPSFKDATENTGLKNVLSSLDELAKFAANGTLQEYIIADPKRVLGAVEALEKYKDQLAKITFGPGYTTRADLNEFIDLLQLTAEGISQYTNTLSEAEQKSKTLQLPKIKYGQQAFKQGGYQDVLSNMKEKGIQDAESMLDAYIQAFISQAELTSGEDIDALDSQISNILLQLNESYTDDIDKQLKNLAKQMPDSSQIPFNEWAEKIKDGIEKGIEILQKAGIQDKDLIQSILSNTFNLKDLDLDLETGEIINFSDDYTQLIENTTDDIVIALENNGYKIDEGKKALIKTYLSTIQDLQNLKFDFSKIQKSSGKSDDNVINQIIQNIIDSANNKNIDDPLSEFSEQVSSKLNKYLTEGFSQVEGKTKQDFINIFSSLGNGAEDLLKQIDKIDWTQNNAPQQLKNALKDLGIQIDTTTQAWKKFEQVLKGMGEADTATHLRNLISLVSETKQIISGLSQSSIISKQQIDTLAAAGLSVEELKDNFYELPDGSYQFVGALQNLNANLKETQTNFQNIITRIEQSGNTAETLIQSKTFTEAVQQVVNGSSEAVKSIASTFSYSKDEIQNALSILQDKKFVNTQQVKQAQQIIRTTYSQIGQYAENSKNQRIYAEQQYLNLFASTSEEVRKIGEELGFSREAIDAAQKARLQQEQEQIQKNITTYAELQQARDLGKSGQEGGISQEQFDQNKNSFIVSDASSAVEANNSLQELLPNLRELGAEMDSNTDKASLLNAALSKAFNINNTDFQVTEQGLQDLKELLGQGAQQTQIYSAALRKYGKQCADAAKNTKELNELFRDGVITVDQFNDAYKDLNKLLDSDVNADDFKNLADYIQQAAEQTGEFSGQAIKSRQDAEDLAQSFLRYGSALTDLSQNYDKYYIAVQNVQSGTGAIITPEDLQLVQQANNVLTDMLDIDISALPQGFRLTVQQIQLMGQVLNGAEGAYQALSQSITESILAASPQAEAFVDTVHYAIDEINDAYSSMESPDWSVIFGEDQYLDIINNMIATLQNFGLNAGEIEALLQGLFSNVDLDIGPIESQLGQVVSAANQMAAGVADAAAAAVQQGSIDAQAHTGQVTTNDKKEVIGWSASVGSKEISWDTPQIVSDGQLGGSEHYTGSVPTVTFDPVPMEENAESTHQVAALQLKSAKNKAGGNIKNSNRSLGGHTPSGGGGGGGKKGGGGGGGGGGAAKKTTINPHFATKTKIQQKQNALDVLKAQQKDLSGNALVENLQKQKELTEEIWDLNKQLTQQMKGQFSVKQQELKEILPGIKFNTDQTIANYEQLARAATQQQIDAMQEYQDYVLKVYPQQVLDTANYEEKVKEIYEAGQKAVREAALDPFKNNSDFLSSQAEYYGKIAQNTYGNGPDKFSALQTAIDYWGKAKDAAEKYYEAVHQQNEAQRADLQKTYGVKFNEDGSVANYNQVVNNKKYGTAAKNAIKQYLQALGEQYNLKFNVQQKIQTQIEYRIKQDQSKWDSQHPEQAQLPDVSDFTYEVDRALTKVSNKLKKIQNLQSGLTGEALISNLQQQKTILQQQMQLQNKKLLIMKQQLVVMQQQLASKFGFSYSDGQISNYEQVRSSAQQKMDQAWKEYQSHLNSAQVQYYKAAYERTKAWYDQVIAGANSIAALSDSIQELELSADSTKITIDTLSKKQEQQRQNMQKQAQEAAQKAQKQAQEAREEAGKQYRKASGLDNKEFIDRSQVDIFHDINRALDDISRNLQRLQKQQDKLLGPALIKNLQNQLGLLEQQKQAYRDKLATAKAQLQVQQGILGQYGLQFNEAGEITNYTSAYIDAYNEMNQAIARYNSLSDEDRQVFGEVDLQLAQKKWEDFKKLTSNYQQILDQIPQAVDGIQDAFDKQLQAQITLFKIKIETVIDLHDVEKRWAQFKRKAIGGFRDDFVEAAKEGIDQIRSYYQINGRQDLGIVGGLSNQLYSTMDIIRRIRSGDTTTAYGDNLKQAFQDLDGYAQQLMSSLEEIQDLQDQVKNAFSEVLDKAQQAFDAQNSQYELINNLFQHDKNLINLMYGDQAYDKMVRFNTLQHQNNLQQLDFLRKQKDMWQQQMNLQRAIMQNSSPGSVDYEEAKNRLQELQQHWTNAVSALNSAIEKSIQNLLDKYNNLLNQIFLKTQYSLTGGLSLSNAAYEWELINKQADRYLDKINTIYQVDKLKKSFNDTINDYQGNIKAQRALNELRDQELKKLAEKQKITKYDIDRANLMLQIKQKQLEMQTAKNSKTTLKLRRDSQGNYNYQYIADENALSSLQQQLFDLQNQLYNLDTDKYKQSLNLMISDTQQYYSQLSQLQQAYLQGDQEAQQKIRLLNEYYQNLITQNARDNEQTKINLIGSSFGHYMSLYADDLLHYQEMSSAQQTIANNFAEWGRQNFGALWQEIKRLQDEGKLNFTNNFSEMETAGISTIIDLDDTASKSSANIMNYIAEMVTQGILNFSDLENVGIDTFNSLSSAQRDIVSNLIIPFFDETIQHMIDKVSGPDGFEPQVLDAMWNLQQAAIDYQDQLDRLQSIAGADFDKISNGIDEAAGYTRVLIEDNGDLIDTYNNMVNSISNVIDQLQSMIQHLNGVRDAAIEALQQWRELKREQAEETLNTSTDVGSNSGNGTGGGRSSKLPSSRNNSRSSGSGSGSGGSGGFNSSNNTTGGSSNGSGNSGSGIGGGSGGSSGHINWPEWFGSFTITEGDSVKAPVVGGDAHISVQYSSGNSGIAKISQGGNIRGVKVGRTTVYAKCRKMNGVNTQGTKTLSMDIDVQENPNAKKTKQKSGKNLLATVGKTDKSTLLDLKKGILASSLDSYDTGGYTGKWNSNQGRLATIHEKELVLNKDDTKNLLSAINIVRDINNSLSFMNPNTSLPSIVKSFLNNNINNDSSELNQNVTITANFPNVNNHNQIERAFGNLINYTSQYIGIKRV